MTSQASAAHAGIDDQVPMLLVGRDHRVSYANPRAHQLFAYADGALHGASIEQLLAPARRAEVRNVQAVLRGQAARRFSSVVRQANGRSLNVELGVEPCLDSRGEVVAVKLRCVRLVKKTVPPPPPPASHFDADSGMRPIVKPRSAPPPLTRNVSRPPPNPTVSKSVPAAAPSLTVSKSAPAPAPSRPVSKSVPAAAPSLTMSKSVPAAVPSLTVSKSAPAPRAVRASTSPPRSVSGAAPARRSRPAPPAVQEDSREQLESALQLLGWLRQRIQAGESLDDPRERARVGYLLEEATELVAEVRCAQMVSVRPRAAG